MNNEILNNYKDQIEQSIVEENINDGVCFSPIIVDRKHSIKSS